MTGRQVLHLLRAYESRNVTFVEPDGSWPIVWQRAKGVHVWDAGGKRYLDLTAAFGVAATGHANPRVVKAGQKQMTTLLHAMGDVHPHPVKAQLARELSRITFERWSAKEPGAQPPDPGVIGRLPEPGRTLTGKAIFCNSGFEAVEAGLKTALLATGKPGVIAFKGAYHGLGYGALNATHRQHFRAPFASQLRQFVRFVPFPKAGEVSGQPPFGANASTSESRDASRALVAVESHTRRLLRGGKIGAILVEPIQVRGGINVPPPDFLALLRQLCDQHQALLIVDEIYTGFGRTGKWFAAEHSAIIPDLICLGKALSGGFPISACVGRAPLMDVAWPPSSGEAIHTSTFLGHPVGCAMALAQIREIRTRKLVERSAELGDFLLRLISCELSHAGCRITSRGLGLLVGVEVQSAAGSPATDVALKAIKTMLHRGFILLPEGEHSNVISFTPPLTISENQLKAAVNALADILKKNRFA